MEHFVFDFTGYILSIKFDKLRKAQKTDSCVFTELELTSLIKLIMDRYPNKIDKFESLNGLTDTLYKLSLKIEMLMSVIWGLFYALPFIMQFTVLKNRPVIIRMCLFSSWVTSGLFFIFENFKVND